MTSILRAWPALLAATALTSCVTVPAEEETSAYGAFLAARYAGVNRDAAGAADYYLEALDRLPGNSVLADRAFITSVIAGDLDRASALAVSASEAGDPSRLATLFRASDRISRHDYRTALSVLDAAPDYGPYNTFFQDILRHWALMGAGRGDEALTEVLDGAKAVGELLGGVADAATAHRMLAQLSQGRLPEVKNPLSCINELNKALAAHDLENAKGAILERVARGIGGVKPMTREGAEGERSALVALIRNLEGYGGLVGGSMMAEALTLRAKMALGGPDGDLNVEQAIAKILSFLPSLPSRAGFVLDLSTTDTGAKQQAAVIRNLAQAMRGLTGIEALTGGGQDLSMAKRVVDILMEKTKASGLPEDLKKTVIATLAKAMAAGSAAAAAAPTPKADAPKEQRWDSGASQSAPPPPKPAAPAANGNGNGPEQRKFVKGQILFEEGDAGTEAFLVVTGSVEIYRRGAVDQTLATLGQGELLGEMSLIDDQPRAASARAAENTTLIVLSKDSLKVRLQRLEQTDKVLHRLMGVLVNRLRGMARTAE